MGQIERMSMKLLLMVFLAAGCAAPVKAQLFSDEALGGALVGGVIGGVVGHNSGRHAGQGAAIGAGAGLLLGAISHNARARREYQSSQGYPDQGYVPSRPNYALSGAVVGGLAGGVIGHNSGRRTGSGIAIGAGAGLLLGGIAEHNARQREAEAAERAALIHQAAAVEAAQISSGEAMQRVVTQQTTVVQTQIATSSPSMAPANTLFGR